MSRLEVDAEESCKKFKTEMSHLSTTLVSSQCLSGVLQGIVHTNVHICVIHGLGFHLEYQHPGGMQY